MIFKYNDDGTVNIEYTNCFYKDADWFKQDTTIPKPFKVNFIETNHHSVKNCLDNWENL